MKLDVPYKMVGTISPDLIQELNDLIEPRHWLVNQIRNKMTNLENTESIILRYFDNYKNVYNKNYRECFVDHQLFDHYRDTVNKFLVVLKQYYDFSDYMCFLAKLQPNSDIGHHKDSGGFLEECHRVHIPIKTNPDVFYIIENIKYNWERGNIYEFDNTRIHGVLNQSNDDRIHLLINLYK